jgi:hypothetical protein
MQLTHEDAHRLIQLNMDKALKPQQLSLLSDHLQTCAACQTYAHDMQEVEQVLFPVLKRQWDRHPLPLSISALMERGSALQPRNILATRTAALGLVVLAFFFGAWQFVLSGSSPSGSLPLIVPLVPTPSTVSTLTMTTSTDCQTMPYSVRENDTLADIAHQFSVSEEEILAVNSLEAVTLSPSMELLIPVCNWTPTGTVHPVTFTTTYTPVREPFTTTPDG